MTRSQVRACSGGERTNSASDSEDDTNSPNTPIMAIDAFSKIMEGSSNILISPTECIPLTCIRKISISGVRRLAAMFDGTSPGTGMLRGHSSSAALPIVLKLTRIHRSAVVEYFMREKGMNEEQASSKYNSRTTWYGIIDGAHRHAAFFLLMERNPEKWGGYRHWATVLLDGDISTLKAFARDRNDKQRKECIVDFTLYDMLSNMREIIRNYSITRGEVIDPQRPRRGLISEIADEYCGGRDAADNTARQVAGVAIKLSDKVIDTLGDIMNTEHPELAVLLLTKDRIGHKAPRVDPDTIDTRVFRSIFSTSTIRGAKLFKKADDELDQIHALYRCRFIAKSAGTIRTVKGKELDDQMRKARAARHEVEKMDTVLGTSEWPQELVTVRENLLNTTLLDEQVADNTGQDTTILPRLRKVYTDHYNPGASQRLALFASGQMNGAQHRENVDGVDKENGTSQIELTESQVTDTSNQVENTRELGSLPLQNSPDNEKGDAENNLPLLPSYGLSSFNMSWEEYQDTIVSSRESIQADFVIADPPYCLPTSRVPTGNHYDDHIDNKEMELFCQFVRRVLIPGGYCVVFTSFHLFTKWKTNFKDQDFTVIGYPLSLIKKTGLLQRSSSVLMPQSGSEFALIARRAGRHRDSFVPPFNVPYRFIKCTHSRKFAIIDNIPPVRKKLKFPGTNRPVRIEEKNTLLLAEILTTFCPANGMVLDVYSGTMTTAIACLATGRRCISIEKDEICYRIAHDRLEAIAGIKKRKDNEGEKENTNGGNTGGESVMSVLMEVSKYDGSTEATSDNDNDDIQEGLQQQSDEIGVEENTGLQPNLEADNTGKEIENSNQEYYEMATPMALDERA